MSKVRVLVVDDEERLRKLVRDFLIKEDYEVLEAFDGQEALEMFEEHPDIALIDVLYECVSALCTVGITAAGTVNFCRAAQFIIILLMFMGRIGPLTLTLAVGMRQQSAGAAIKLPEENVTIG